MTGRRKPPPVRMYRREAYPTDGPGSTATTSDEKTWARWSDGNDYVANTGGAVRLYVGDVVWREVPFNPADRTAAHTTHLRDMLEDLARRMDERSRDGDAPSDCLAMMDFAGELRALIAPTLNLELPHLTSVAAEMNAAAGDGCPKCTKLHFPWCAPFGGPGYAADDADDDREPPYHFGEMEPRRPAP